VEANRKNWWIHIEKHGRRETGQNTKCSGFDQFTASSQTREENASQGGSVQQFALLPEELNSRFRIGHIFRIRVYQIMRLCRSQPFRDTEFYTHDYLILSPCIFYMPPYKLFSTAIFYTTGYFTDTISHMHLQFYVPKVYTYTYIS
jgi:hypothetical protein